MVIHHDKMAYGKLDSLSDKLSEEKLAAMAKLLSEGADEGKVQEDASVAANKPKDRAEKDRSGARKK